MTTIPASATIAMDRPVDRVLDRLDRVRKTPRGWTARCPAHDDRFPSLSIGIGRKGCVVLKCFAGCTALEVVNALGLELTDLFADEPSRRSSLPKPKPYALPRQLVQIILESPEWPLTWEVAKLFGRCSREQAKLDVLSAWDSLVGRGVNVPLAWELGGLIRGVAMLNFADPSDPLGSLPRAVDRLLVRETA